MIKNIKSSEVKNFIKENSKTVLIDVRTEEEWKAVGKPLSDSLGIKTFFITIGQDQNFIEIVKEKINKDSQILVMCAAGGRSSIAANFYKRKVIMFTIYLMDLVETDKTPVGKILDYLRSNI